MPGAIEPMPFERNAFWDFVIGVLDAIRPYVNSVMDVLMWLALLIVFSLLLLLVAVELKRYMATLRGTVQVGHGGDDANNPALELDTLGTLADADRLAAAGDFAGAVRILLFRSLDAVRLKIDKVVFPFLTTRELLEIAPLGDAARHALHAVISMEELSHFGGRNLDGAAYADCRGSFLRFVEECGGATA